MILVVCGSRVHNTHAAYQWVSGTLDDIHKHHSIELIMHGGAEGPDTFSGWWASRNDVQYTIYRPVWRTNGQFNPKAGYDRNDIMVEKLRDAIMHGWPAKLIAFWDGKSRGTAEAVRYAKRIDVPTEVYG